MIKSFACRETEKIFEGHYSKVFPNDIQRTARRKLLYLDEVDVLEDLKSPPGNRLEKLNGDREGQMSIRINQQFRISFRWTEKSIQDVQIIDYH